MVVVEDGTSRRRLGAQRPRIDTARTGAAGTSKECRIEVWTRERPTEWNPDQVVNPESAMPFTKAGAWEFVAQTLDSGHPFTEVEMRQPPNEKGYVIEVDLGPGSPRLYVKLQISRGRIIGRSFHYSLR